MIHLYTGDGKGKTTAAMGLAARAAGYDDNRVLIVQFMKCGTEGEARTLAAVPNIEYVQNSYKHGFVFRMTNEEKAKLTQEHNKHLAYAAERAKAGNVFLIVLDELASAYGENVIDRAAADALLDDHGGAELVITGRNPWPKLVEKADYITEMKCVRHPYETKKAPARQGVEY